MSNATEASINLTVDQHVAAIMLDLRAAGYMVRCNGARVDVSLMRRVTRAEVVAALDAAGYNECQYSTAALPRGVVGVSVVCAA